MVQQSEYILSIVPPRDALSTAERFITASRSLASTREPVSNYVDLNAVSPTSAVKMEEIFSSTSIHFIDGGIIGGAPELQQDETWSKPSLVVSGPYKIDEQLADVLNVTHVADTVGPASGLKMCFASMTKGLTAIAIQSFTTAHRLGVLDQLRMHLMQYSPKTGELAGRGLVGMPPKAYRWVDEMKEIAATFHHDGGFEKDMFEGVSEVYRLIADDTELGQEKTESRTVGMTPEDVAKLVTDGLERKKVKAE